MKRRRSPLLLLGVALYLIMGMMDRFIAHLPNVVYIPLALVGVVLIVAGCVEGRSPK